MHETTTPPLSVQLLHHSTHWKLFQSAFLLFAIICCAQHFTFGNLYKRYCTYFYSKTNQMHNISNLLYFGTTLYMYRTVFPFIIRSLRLYIQHQVHVKQILLTACQRERDGTHVLDGLSVHRQESKTVHTTSGTCQTDSADRLLAGTRWSYVPSRSRQQEVSRIRSTYTCCCMYSLRLLMMNRKTVRKMQSAITK